MPPRGLARNHGVGEVPGSIEMTPTSSLNPPGPWETANISEIETRLLPVFFIFGQEAVLGGRSPPSRSQDGPFPVT